MSILVSDADAEKALEILSDETGAAHRAAHEWLSDCTKSILAELMAESNEKSAAAQEAWARRQPKFLDHLQKVGAMAKQDYMARQRYSAAEAKLRIWQTVQANARGMERVR